MPEQAFQVAEGPVVAVRGTEGPVHGVRSRHCQQFLRNPGADVSQEALRLGAQKLFDARDIGHEWFYSLL